MWHGTLRQPRGFYYDWEMGPFVANLGCAERMPGMVRLFKNATRNTILMSRRRSSGETQQLPGYRHRDQDRHREPGSASSEKGLQSVSHAQFSGFRPYIGLRACRSGISRGGNFAQRQSPRGNMNALAGQFLGWPDPGAPALYGLLLIGGKQSNERLWKRNNAQRGVLPLCQSALKPSVTFTVAAQTRRLLVANPRVQVGV